MQVSNRQKSITNWKCYTIIDTSTSLMWFVILPLNILLSLLTGKENFEVDLLRHHPSDDMVVNSHHLLSINIKMMLGEAKF